MRGLRSGAMALLTLVALLAACSSTTLSGSWKDPEFRGKISKVYLVGVAKQEINRRLFEEAFVRELSTLGVTGIASYRQLPPDQFDSRDSLIGLLDKSGADSILMARMTSLRTETVTSPGYVSGAYAPAPYYRNWDSYYAQRYDAIYQPPTTTEFQIATIEANLYEVRTGKLIWSAQLETIVESDLERLFGDFVKTVTKDLRKEGLL